MIFPAPLKWFSLGVVGAFALFLVGLPIFSVLGGIQASQLIDPTVLAIVRASLFQASLSVVFSVVLGLPLGLWIGNLAQAPDSGPLARTAFRLLAMPYGVPTIVAATIWVSWLGYGFHSVVLAHVLLNAPWIALVAGAARARVPVGELDAAESLGGGAREKWKAVIWPRLRLPLGAGATQVFALCTMSFAIVLILGGGPPVETLESAIYAKLRFGALNMGGASTLAAWEMLLTLLPWGIVLWFENRAGTSGSGSLVTRAPRASRMSFASPRAQALVAVVAATLFLLPYLGALGRDGFSALASSGTREALTTSLSISLKLALCVAAAALFLATAAILAVSAFKDQRAIAASVKVLVSVPAGISTMVLGLGVWCAYERWVDPFAGGLWPIVAVQAALFVPLAFRLLYPLLEGVRSGELAAAATLGSGPLRAFFAIEWPRWKRPLLVAGGMIAGAGLSELAAVSLFYSERVIPLPLLISRWMNQYRFAEARGGSAVLLILAMVVIGLFARGWGTEEAYAGSRR